MQEIANTITETIVGFKVKNLTWKPIENIFVGLVQDPIFGKPELRDCFVSAGWRSNGTLLKKFGGDTRTDLNLKLKKTYGQI